MSYRIVYHGDKNNKCRNSFFMRTVLTVSFFLCFLWTVNTFWPEGKSLLRLLLIPGDPDATLEAMQVFSEELSTGFPLKAAAKNVVEAIVSGAYPG